MSLPLDTFMVLVQQWLYYCVDNICSVCNIANTMPASYLYFPGPFHATQFRLGFSLSPSIFFVCIFSLSGEETNHERIRGIDQKFWEMCSTCDGGCHALLQMWSWLSDSLPKCDVGCQAGFYMCLSGSLTNGGIVCFVLFCFCSSSSLSIWPLGYFWNMLSIQCHCCRSVAALLEFSWFECSINVALVLPFPFLLSNLLLAALWCLFCFIFANWVFIIVALLLYFYKLQYY